MTDITKDSTCYNPKLVGSIVMDDKDRLFGITRDDKRVILDSKLGNDPKAIKILDEITVVFDKARHLHVLPYSWVLSQEELTFAVSAQQLVNVYNDALDNQNKAGI
jgi:hypothetical protein